MRRIKFPVYLFLGLVLLLMGSFAGKAYSADAPTIAKSFASANIALNGTTTMSFAVANPNASDGLTGIAFTDTLPAGVTADNGTTSVCGGSLAITGSNLLTFTGGTLVANGTCNIDVTVTGTTAGAKSNTTSVITATAPGPVVLTGTTATATLTVYAAPTVTKTFTPAIIASGGTSSMVITVTNPAGNPGNLTGVSITDDYSITTLANNAIGSVACSGAGSATLSGGSDTGKTVGFTAGTIVPGGTCTITQSVTATSSVSNTTGAPSATDPVSLTGTTATATLAISPTVTKSFASSNISSGSNTNLTVTIGNSNATAITLSSAFTDTFPAGMTINTAGNSGTCPSVTATAGATSFTMASGASIPTGGCTVIVNVTKSTVGTVTNTIAINALQTSAGNNASEATASLTVYAASPAASYLVATVTRHSGDTPGSIYPGQTARLQITLSNNSASQMTGVVFSNTLPGSLPDGLKVSGAATYTCTNPIDSTTSAGVGTLTAAQNTQSISLSGTGGTIPARANNTDGTCTIVIPVTAGTSTGNQAAYAYLITGGSVLGFVGGSSVTNYADASQTLNVAAITKPTVSKSFGSSTVYLGGSSTTLTVTVTNSNTVAIPNFSITDTFPQLGGSAIIKVAATPAASSSCSSGSNPVVSAAAGATSITATGTIPAKSGETNGSCTFTVSVEAAHTNGAYTTGEQHNTITTTQLTNDLGIPAAADASAHITVNSPLNVTKSRSAGNIAAGEAGYFTITLTNSGLSPLTASFTDNPIDGDGVPSHGLSVTTATSACGGTVTLISAGGRNTGISASSLPIAAGASCAVTINFTGSLETANTPHAYTNSLAAGAVNVGNAAIVSPAASASLNVYDNLRVEKSVSPTNATPGNPVQYQVTVQNWSSGPIGSVTVTDALPSSQTFLTGTINGINYTPNGGSCSLSGFTGSTGDSTPTFTLASIPARSGNSPGSCTITFWAMTSSAASSGATYTNTLGAGSVCYDPGLGNVCNGWASNTTSGTIASVLSVAKTFSYSGTTTDPTNENLTNKLTLPEGTIVRVAITLSNLSVNPLTAVAISDTMPIAIAGIMQMQIANPANAATTCGGEITAVAGSTSLALSGGTVPARSGSAGAAGSCKVEVDVVGAAGTYLNRADITGVTQVYANNTSNNFTATSNNARITYNSSLSATKSFSPSAVSSGGKSTVTVRLSNSGSAALTNVAITDPLPTNMVVAPTPNAYTTCAGSTSIAAVAGASSAGMTGATIAGLGTCDFIFDVVATGSANWVNTIPVGNITADGGVKNQTAVAATLTYNAPSYPSVLKATDPSTLTFPGEISRLTITISNGSQAVTNLRLTDYFTSNGTAGGSANGMVISATPAALTTCPGGIVSAVAGGTSVGVSGVSLAASAAPCSVSVNVTSTAVGSIINTIPANSILNDQGLTNITVATTSLGTSSNIGVVKQFTPNVVKPGQRSRLRITFYNPTSLPMANLAVTDTLPANVTVPSGPNFVTTCTGATVSSPSSDKVQISGGNIAAASGAVSASCYAESDVIVSAQGDYLNTIATGAVTANSGGSSTSNSQPTSDTLRAKSPLVIHKGIGSYTLDTGSPVGLTTGTASRTPGTSASLVVRIDNPNAVALTAAAFTDTLPTGLVVATTPNASTTCAGGTVVAPESATSIRLSGATIPAGSYCTVTVDVLSNISGSYTNTIAAGAVTTAEGVSNEEPTSAKIIVSTPPTVSKQFAPAVIAPGGTSTLTIFLGNSNSSLITLSSAFTDTLPTAPGNIVVYSTPGVTSTCGGGAGAVTAAAGTGTITLASGNTIPAGGCTISVNVTGATSGAHINNIPAGSLVTDFGSNQQPANSTLTISTMGFISGRVFKDNKVIPTGIFVSGTDTPISGASIRLISGANCTGSLVSVSGMTNPATTDAAGNYLFSGLSAGTYSVCQTEQPTGTLNSITTAGTITAATGSTNTAGVASNPATPPPISQIVGIILGTGTGSDISGSTGNNFAEVVPSSISGTVFIDYNNNGIQNGADVGINNVLINLTGYSYGPNGIDDAGLVDDVTVAAGTHTHTDASGNYSFTNLAPGKYTVTEPTQPTDTANGITTAGAVENGGTAGTVTVTTTVPSSIGTTTKIKLPPNTATTGNNFAEIPLGRRISGVVFLDYNAVWGTLDGADHGIGSQTINLTGTDINLNAVAATTTTAADGTYSFTGLPEGTYIVTQPNQPTGTTNGITTAGSGGTATAVGVTPSAISAINLTGDANTVSANNNFAELVAAASDLALAKTHTPASFGVSSSTGYFTLTPSNVGNIATSGTITLTDTLPVGLTPTSAAGTGWSCGINVRTVSCTTTSVIAAASSGTPTNGNPIIVHVTVGAGLSGQILQNTATVAGGGEPVGFDGNNSATDTVTIAATASLSGTVWLDANHDKVPGSPTSEPRLANWIVELYLDGVIVGSTVSATDGSYSFANISPGSGYQVKFRATANGAIFGKPVTNEDGITFDGVDAAKNPTGANTTDGTLKSMTLVSGNNYTKQSLPVDPSGVVYDSITRLPVSGATVTLSGTGSFDAATHLVGGTASATQVTGANGYYQFLLLAGAPSVTYTLTITPPPGYIPLPSAIIPATAGPFTVPGLSGVYAIQAQPTAPSGSQTTTYYFSFIMGGSTAGVVNNHIPIDPILGGAILTTKTTPLVNVKRGDLVPYTITMTNTLSATIPNIDARDIIPPGFKYRTGSGTLNGVRTEPVVAGRQLTWRNLTFTAAEKKTFLLILVVGSGVSEGEYTNQAYALNNIVNTAVSNIATATVRVVPDPTFDCSEIIGKVFDDKNANGYQDEGEPGIANVRLATARGLLVTTDAEGRFHIPCPQIPNENRGSNFVMKLDDRTLPSGYRITTENPRVVRLTRGKMTKMNFGATVHRVIRIDVNDAAFEKDGTKLQDEWQKKIEELETQLRERSTVVRIAYRMGADSKKLVDGRIKAIRDMLQKIWKKAKDCPPLVFEEEIVEVR